MSAKIIEDELRVSAGLLSELNTLLKEVINVRWWCQPYGREQREKFKTLPQYMAATRSGLQSACIKNFESNYPTISSVIADGDGSSSIVPRLHNGVYKLSSLNNKLKKLNYLVKFDDDRDELRDLANLIIADLAIFILTQYKLDEYNSWVYLSVSEYCQREGITPGLYAGNMWYILESTGQTLYGYDALSKYYDDMNELDSAFLVECEENDFPLTDELCEKILSGKLPMAEARGMLIEHMKTVEKSEVKNINPSNMVQMLNLS